MFDQLDLFDRVTDEDAKDADADADGDTDVINGDEGSDVMIGDELLLGDADITTDESDACPGDNSRLDMVASVRADQEPRAVTSMRKLAEAVESDEIISAELELIADKLGRMGAAAGCGPDLWRKVR